MIRVADLFCGGGGTSTGVKLAARDLGLTVELIAINHWDVAIQTHSANHPEATHLCESLDSVDPRKVVPSGRLHLLVASPECTHHSNARGGKPMCDQSRASAWHILRWAEALRIDAILIENVREFLNWGPIGANGRPMKSKRGHTFHAFMDSLKSLGYKVDHRLLNAADYGDPTTRERLFIQAVRGKRKISWPEPSHAKPSDTFLPATPWRTAREIIDWKHKGESIYERKRPLKPATMARIMAGIRKFSGDPFLAVLRNNQDAASLEEPLGTVTTSGAHFALCEPFIVAMENGGFVDSIDRPVRTITTARGGAFALCEPFLVTVNHGDDESNTSAARCRSVSEPMPVLTTRNGLGLCEPFIVSYYSNGSARPIGEPLDTITCKDRFGLVSPEMANAVLDIRFRMLTPRELARAMSFPDDYTFSGTRESQVKQIGNAVPVRLAAAISRELLSGRRNILPESPSSRIQ